MECISLILATDCPTPFHITHLLYPISGKTCIEHTQHSLSKSKIAIILSEKYAFMAEELSLLGLHILLYPDQKSSIEDILFWSLSYWDKKEILILLPSSLMLTQSSILDFLQEKKKKSHTISLCSPDLDLREALLGISIEKLKQYLFLEKKASFSCEELAKNLSPEISSTIRSDLVSLSSLEKLISSENQYQYQEAQKLIKQGVYITQPQCFINRGIIYVEGLGIRIDTNCIFEGQVYLEENVQIGAHCILRESRIRKNSRIEPYSFIENSCINSQCHIGPFSRIREHSLIGSQSRIGCFVEIKKSHMGRFNKACHLSYIGDTETGEHVNIGAMAVTCNFDGYQKHKTHIANQAFIGSGSQLVAPVSIEANALIAAGTTVTRNAPKNHVTLSRLPQTSYPRKPSK